MITFSNVEKWNLAITSILLGTKDIKVTKQNETIIAYIHLKTALEYSLNTATTTITNNILLIQCYDIDIAIALI